MELDKIKPMIAMPFHPSNTYTIEEVNSNLMDILDEGGEKSRRLPGRKGSLHAEEIKCAAESSW